MLPEIGATELLVIAAVALIVVGPKDLPLLMRKVAQFLARLRGMAAEFRSSFDEMARQSELDELRKEVAALRRGDFGPDVQGWNATSDEFDKAMREVDAQLRNPLIESEPEAYSEVQPLPPPEVAQELEAAPKARKPRASRVKAVDPETGDAPAPKAPRKRAPRKAAPKADGGEA